MELWYFSIARLLVGIGFLSVASIKDLKTRRVPNKLWIIMGSVGILILFTELLIRKFWLGNEIFWTHFLIFIPIGIIFSEAFVERPPVYSKDGLNFKVLLWLLIPVIVFVYMVFVLGGSMIFWTLAMIPGMMLFAFLLYFLYILYGGADAKAVITLAVLVPFYPQIPGLTRTALASELIPLMQTLFPFTLVILLNASLVVLVLPIGYLLINLYKRDLDFPRMFFGFKKSVEEIEDSFVWPMEYYENGKLKTELFPRSSSEEKLKSLRSHGREIVWTTPKIPFIAPISIGFLISFLIGNPLLYLF